ncbi:hypothetical protein MUP59_09450 [Candidatus Bathyarchaeota archaeon]|nr:hypothetical protein [Candidatus Bathyarchaeota archaeon]
MVQIAQIMVKGELVKIDMDKMAQLIEGGIDGNTAIIESIVEAIEGGKVCQVIGMNQYTEIARACHASAPGNQVENEKKAMELFKVRNPKGFECVFGSPRPPQQPGYPPQPQNLPMASPSLPIPGPLTPEDTGERPVTEGEIDVIAGAIRRIDPSKVEAYYQSVKLAKSRGIVTMNEALRLGDSLVGQKNLDRELEKEA